MPVVEVHLTLPTIPFAHLTALLQWLAGEFTDDNIRDLLRSTGHPASDDYTIKELTTIMAKALLETFQK